MKDILGRELQDRGYLCWKRHWTKCNWNVNWCLVWQFND